MLVCFVEGVFPLGVDKGGFDVVAGNLVVVPISGIACSYEKAVQLVPFTRQLF